MEDTKYSPIQWEILIEKVSISWKRKSFRGFIGLCLAVVFSLIVAFAVTTLLYKLLFDSSGVLIDVGPFLVLLIAFFFISSFWLVAFFWPFLFFFYALKQTDRRQSLVALIQNSLKSKASLPMVLRAYASTVFSPFYRRKLNRFAYSLESGISFQDAVNNVPGILPAETVRLIALHGDSPETIDLISDGLTNDNNRSYIHAFSLTRFGYLLAVAWQFVLMAAFITVFILPRFQEIYRDFDSHLPHVTGIFMVWSRTLLPWFSLILLVGGFAALLFLLMKLEIVEIRPWVLRRFFRDSDSAKLLRLLGLALQRKTPLSQAMVVYRQSLKSYFLRRRGAKILRAIDSGANWLTVLKRQRIINSNEADLLELAQQAGNCGLMLNELALAREEKQLRNDDTNSKLLFTVCILFGGLMVTFFASAMLLPVFNLIRALGN